MNTVMHSEVFFFISSIGFVVLGVLAAVFLFYLIRSIKTFDRIIARAEKDIDSIGDITQDMLADVRDSSIFRFIFKKHKKRVR